MPSNSLDSVIIPPPRSTVLFFSIIAQIKRTILQNISPLGKLFTFFVRRQHQRKSSHFVPERALIPLTFFRVLAIKIGIRPILPKKEERAYMHLNEAQKDKDYIVKSIGLPFETERRLQALGMTDDTPIRVVNRK